MILSKEEKHSRGKVLTTLFLLNQKSSTLLMKSIIDLTREEWLEFKRGMNSGTLLDIK